MKNKKRILTIAVVLFAASNLFAHSEAIQPDFVEELMEQYFAAQKALAADDFAETQTAATQYTKILNLKPALSMKPSIIKIKRAASKLRKADDLDHARVAFQKLSTEMQSLVEDVGIKRGTLLYVARCPMAFGNEGGSWIQADTVISNPYLGVSMLRCGNIDALGKSK